MDKLTVTILLVVALGVLVYGAYSREKARDARRPQGQWTWTGTGWAWVAATPPAAGLANRAAAKALGLVLVACALVPLLVWGLWVLYQAGVNGA